MIGAANHGPAMQGEAGFSLIEALVAMAILALAATALIRASEAHVDSVRGLERRTAAEWVAQNRLAELQLSGAALPAQTDMLGERWAIATERHSTDDPDMDKVTVRVRPVAETATMARLNGFAEAGAVR